MGNKWNAVPRMDGPGWNVYENEHHLVAHVVWEEDARFIASAPELVDSLRAESEAAKREVERLTRERDDHAAKRAEFAAEARSLRTRLDEVTRERDEAREDARRLRAAVDSARDDRDTATQRASEATEAYADLLSRVAADGTLDAAERRASQAHDAVLEEAAGIVESNPGGSWSPFTVRSVAAAIRAAKEGAVMEKTCENCKYYELDYDEGPCLTCDCDVGGKHINWTHPEAEDASDIESARRSGRAEAAEKRVAELEIATLVCPACCEAMHASQAVPVRELVARAEAAEERAAELESALESCQRARRAAERRVEELEGALRRIHPERVAPERGNDPPQCLECGEEYLLTDGCDLTAECDSCAQALLSTVRGAARVALAAGNGAARTEAPCTRCGGTGRVPFDNRLVQCGACGGTGKTPAREG